MSPVTSQHRCSALNKDVYRMSVLIIFQTRRLSVIRVPTAPGKPGKPGKMVTVFPAWKNPGICQFCQISWKNETNPGNLRTFDSYIARECISKNLPALLHSA